MRTFASTLPRIGHVVRDVLPRNLVRAPSRDDEPDVGERGGQSGAEEPGRLGVRGVAAPDEDPDGRFLGEAERPSGQDLLGGNRGKKAMDVGAVGDDVDLRRVDSVVQLEGEGVVRRTGEDRGGTLAELALQAFHHRRNSAGELFLAEEGAAQVTLHVLRVVDEGLVLEPRHAQDDREDPGMAEDDHVGRFRLERDPVREALREERQERKRDVHREVRIHGLERGVGPEVRGALRHRDLAELPGVEHRAVSGPGQS